MIDTIVAKRASPKCLIISLSAAAGVRPAVLIVGFPMQSR